MRGSWRLAFLGSIVVAAAVAACSSTATGGTNPPGSSAGSSGAPASAPSGGSTSVHTAAITVCSLLDEPTFSALAGFPAKFFGAGDPVARVPVADQTFVNANGAALRIGYCGYWETGTQPELSRDISIEVTQGDPAKPGTWSADAAHGQYEIYMAHTANPPTAISGLGDEAYSASKTSGTSVVVRSGDLIVSVEGDSPPNTSALSTDVLEGIAKAVLGKV